MSADLEALKRETEYYLGRSSPTGFGDLIRRLLGAVEELEKENERLSQLDADLISAGLDLQAKADRYDWLITNSSDDTWQLERLLAEESRKVSTLGDALKAISELGDRSPYDFLKHAEFHAAVHVARKALMRLDEVR